MTECKEIWLGNGDKLIADIYAEDGNWAGVGIFQPEDGKTHGIGEHDGRIDGEPIENAHPIAIIKSIKPESLQVLVDEINQSIERMSKDQPHTVIRGQSGNAHVIPISVLPDIGPVKESVPQSWINAMQLAMDICDMTPGFCHETDYGPLGKIGKLVNCQDDGDHGYALIRDSLEEMRAKKK